jgi:hypothetical protein
MRSKHIYQKRNSHLKVRQEKKRMNLTSQKKASEHSHNGDSVFLLLVYLEDFVIAALETKLLLAQCYCLCSLRPNYILHELTRGSCCFTWYSRKCSSAFDITCRAGCESVQGIRRYPRFFLSFFLSSIFISIGNVRSHSSCRTQTDVLDVHFLLSFDLFGSLQSGTIYWSAIICHIDSPDLFLFVQTLVWKKNMPVRASLVLFWSGMFLLLNTWISFFFYLVLVRWRK